MSDEREDVELAIRELGIQSPEERGMMRLTRELELAKASAEEKFGYADSLAMDTGGRPEAEQEEGVGEAILTGVLLVLFLLAVWAILVVLTPSARGDELPAAPVAKREEVSKARVALTLANGGLAFADVGYTRANWGPGAREYDPLARPIIEHGGVCYALAGAETVGLAWLGGRMRRSRRWYRVWWMPQAVGIAGHAYALSRTMERGR